MEFIAGFIMGIIIAVTFTFIVVMYCHSDVNSVKTFKTYLKFLNTRLNKIYDLIEEYSMSDEQGLYFVQGTQEDLRHEIAKIIDDIDEVTSVKRI